MYNEIQDRVDELQQSLREHVYEVEEIINLMTKLDSSNEYYYDLMGDLDSLKNDIALMLEEDSYIDKDFKYIRKDIQKINGK